MTLGGVLSAILRSLPTILQLIVRWLNAREADAVARDLRAVRKALAHGDTDTLSRKLAELLEN